jgi:hypothetical protein
MTERVGDGREVERAVALDRDGVDGVSACGRHDGGRHAREGRQVEGREAVVVRTELKGAGRRACSGSQRGHKSQDAHLEEGEEGRS